MEQVAVAQRTPSRLSERTLDTENISAKESLQKKWVQKVSDILHPDFHHPHAPIKEHTMRRICTSELVSLAIFLLGDDAVSKNLQQRPECPIKSPRHQSSATYDYKQAMIEYISGFGHKFHKEPCSYPPAFLEALANYCERKTEEINEKGIRESDGIYCFRTS